jgi:hypothetical protein
MIYHLVIDGLRWRGSFRSPRLMMDGRTIAWLRSRGLPVRILERIGEYKERIFFSERQLMKLVEKVLGESEIAAHRATIMLLPENCQRVPDVEHVAMDTCGSLGPENRKDPRLRLYFTELGWERVGRAVAVQARRLGHEVKVRRHRQAEASRIVYRDELQVATLPTSPRTGTRTRPATRPAPCDRNPGSTFAVTREPCARN